MNQQKQIKKNQSGSVAISIVLSVGAAVIFVISLAVIFFMLKTATEELDNMADQRYQSYLLADEMRQSSDDLTRLGRTYVVTGDDAFEKQYNDVIAIRGGTKPRPQDYWRSYWDFVAAGNEKPRPDDIQVPLLELMKKAGFTAEELGKLEEAQARSDGLVALETEAMNAVKGLYKDSSGGYTIRGAPDMERARQLVHSPDYHRFKAQIMVPTDEFFVMLNERTSREKEAAKVNLVLLQNLFLVMLVATLAAFASTVYFGYKQMLKQLGGRPEQLDTIAKELAVGNLAVKMPQAARASALGRIGEMTTQLRNLINSLNDSIHRVNETSHTLGSNMRAGTSAASETSTAASAMAASVEQMSVSITHIADSAREATELAESSANKADEGHTIIDNSANEMRTIAELVEEVSKRIGELGNDSERISGVVEVIREVAEQTNLLALNAAIEAARAGETGRGFAVVADEVRKLAERTASATGEISEMVHNIQESSKNAETTMARANERIVSGVEYSARAAEAIEGIREDALHTRSVIQEMSSAMSEQSSSSQTLATQVEQVAANSEESQRASESSSELARDLECLSDELEKLAKGFRI